MQLAGGRGPHPEAAMAHRPTTREGEVKAGMSGQRKALWPGWVHKRKP